MVLSWLSAFLGFFWCFWAPAHLSEKNYQYDSSQSAQYAALSSIVFALSLAWVVFACNFGYGGILNGILCSKLMIFLNRISYSLYLIQFIVFFTFVGRQRHTEHFSLTNYIDTTELAVLVVSALLLTLLIDLPMQNIRRIILTPSEETPKVKEKEVVKEVQKSKTPEPDFISPWDDVKEEEEYVPFKSRRLSDGNTEKRMSPREYFKNDFDEKSSPWSSHR